jgi:CheY-like chemotaxis protein
VRTQISVDSFDRLQVIGPLPERPSTLVDTPSNVEAARSNRTPVNEGCAGDEKKMKALRVLVVKDDALIGMLFADVLAEMGHEVCAIEANEANAVGSGISAVEKIRRTGFVPHVFVSGDVSSVRARRPDAVVIQKPFREPELARAIQRALSATAAS